MNVYLDITADLNRAGLAPNVKNEPDSLLFLLVNIVMDLKTFLVSSKLPWFLNVCLPLFSSHTCCPYPGHAPSPRGQISEMAFFAVSTSSS